MKLLDMWFKGLFQETKKISKFNHRCTSIRWWVLRTGRHRLMDIGAVLADDKTSYFVICWQEMWHFFVKRIIQCSTDEIKR